MNIDADIINDLLSIVDMHVGVVNGYYYLYHMCSVEKNFEFSAFANDIDLLFKKICLIKN